MDVAEVAGGRPGEQRYDECHRQDDDRSHLGVAAADEPGPNRDREQAESDPREHAEENREHVLESHDACAARRVNVRLAVAGGCAAGFASGWNISNTGAVAQQLEIGRASCRERAWMLGC